MPKPKNFTEQLRNRYDVLIVVAVIAYFTIRILYFAISIHPEIPPDETTHYGQSLAYSKALFIPENGVDSYEYGLVTNRPYLFYWLMGKLLHFNVFSINTLVFLRLINGLMGVVCAVFVYKWARVVTTNKLVRILTVVLFTNILMLTGLFGSVNYDNLVNLFAVMSFYYLAVFYIQRAPETFAKLFLCVLAGCLCKTAFLPLAVMFAVAFAVKYLIDAKNSGDYKLVKSFRSLGMRNVVLFLATLIFFVLNILLYGGNLLKYGTITPDAQDIVGVENALKNRIFARNYIVEQYKEGNYTFDHAIKMTEVIKNMGDRRMAVALLRNTRDYDQIKPRLMDLSQYSTVWFHRMLRNAVGYFGHARLLKTTWEIYPYYWILLAGAFCILRKINIKDAENILFTVFLITVLYSLILLCRVNYKIYYASGTSVAMVGRYLFPVLLPMCGLMSYYMINFLSAKKQLIITILISAWFIYGDFFFFLKDVPDNWLIRDWPI